MARLADKLLQVTMAAVMLFARIERRVLPVSWLYGMGLASARFMYFGLPGLRRALHANARHLLGPGASHRAQRRLALAVLVSFTRFFVELLTAPKTYPEPEAFLARMVGRAHGERARALGKGVISVTLHMGNFELGPMLLSRLVRPQPVAIVYRRDPFGLIEAMRSEQRTEHGIEEIDTGNALFGVRVLDVLRRGGFVLAAADVGFEEGRNRGKLYPFLEGRARLLDWPARLAVASGAPLLPSFVVRGPGGYRAEMLPALVPADGEDADALMRRLIPVLEDYVRRYPEQWLILHRYWEEQDAAETSSAVDR